MKSLAFAPWVAISALVIPFNKSSAFTASSKFKGYESLLSRNVMNRVSSPSYLTSVVVRMSNKNSRETDNSLFNDRNVPVVPFSSVSYDLDSIQNKGPFAWMVPYLGLIGFSEGNKLEGAVPVKVTDVDLTDEERYELKKKAAESLTNIGLDERERRSKLGDTLLIATFVYGTFSSIFLDDGMLFGHLVKLGVLPLFALGRSLKLSSELGLWNLAQAGLWDVAGEIEPVDDPTVATALLEKVNALNIRTSIDALVVSVIWSALPQSVTQPISLLGVASAVLYLLRGRIPDKV